MEENNKSVEFLEAMIEDAHTVGFLNGYAAAINKVNKKADEKRKANRLALAIGIGGNIAIWTAPYAYAAIKKLSEKLKKKEIVIGMSSEENDYED